MARLGRPPKPIERHIKEGTLGTRQRAKTPLLIGGRAKALPLPPDYLTPDVVEAYKFLIDHLWESQVLDIIDIPLVIEAATLYGRAIEAAKDIKKRGLHIMTIRGARSGKGVRVKVINPAINVERESWAKFNQVADRLGIGAQARATLAFRGVKGKAPEKEIPGLEDFGKLRIVKNENA